MGRGGQMLLPDVSRVPGATLTTVLRLRVDTAVPGGPGHLARVGGVPRVAGLGAGHLLVLGRRLQGSTSTCPRLHRCAQFHALARTAHQL